MMKIFKELLADERATAVDEYALMLALIAVVTIISITALRDSIIGTFDATSSASASAAPASGSPSNYSVL